MIYFYGLVASEPITVWSGTYRDEDSLSETYRDEESLDHLGKVTRKSWKTVDTNITASDDFALGLLLCSQQISRDAAATLYRQNTFRFMGDDNWSPLYAFLVMIGPENRRNLRNLEIQMPKPKQVLQHPDGTRTSLDDWPFSEVIPFNRRLLYHSTPDEDGCVDHLDPAIEACFRILGKSRPALTLTLRLNRHLLPGLFPYKHPQDFNYFSMDLPVMIEKPRQELTTGSDGKSQVDVLWKGECLRDRFAHHADKQIRGNRWVIVEREDGYLDHDGLSGNRIILTTLFTLRWKKWVEDLA